MTKGDDAITRRKNKAKRRKLNKKESSNVSARIAAIIAAKNRRKSGKRRQCQGMCFSLPTPEDPFNDRHGNKDFQIKDNKKKPFQVDKKASASGKSTVSNKGTGVKSNAKVDHHGEMKEKKTTLISENRKLPVSVHKLGQKGTGNFERTGSLQNGKGGHLRKALESVDYPSKFLILCLNEIENSLRHDVVCKIEEEKPLFVNSWGVEFWKCYSSGKDILETSGSSSTVEQVAWIASTAADTIARKEKEGHSFTSPFMLFLVPSQEKAVKVRSMCKPLKALGIHTVSLHSGAVLDHQINGLKSCEPEFLVSTPERLLELIAVKAIDISGVSLLVVDGLEAFYKGGCLGSLNSIRQYISGEPHTLVFSDSHDYTSIEAVKNLLVGSVNRLSLNDSVASKGACIVQSVNVCASEEDVLVKAVKALDHAYLEHVGSQPIRVLYVVGKDRKSRKLVSTLKSKGYSISNGGVASAVSEVKSSDDADKKTSLAVTIVNKEHIHTTELQDYEEVIILGYVPSIIEYLQILTSMARQTVYGKLHSFFTEEDAPPYSAELIEILEQCGQAVRDGLRDACPASPMSDS